MRQKNKKLYIYLLNLKDRHLSSGTTLTTRTNDCVSYCFIFFLTFSKTGCVVLFVRLGEEEQERYKVFKLFFLLEKIDSSVKD